MVRGRHSRCNPRQRLRSAARNPSLVVELIGRARASLSIIDAGHVVVVRGGVVSVVVARELHIRRQGERCKAVRECTKRPGRERSGKQSAPRIHNEGCGVRAHPPPRGWSSSQRGRRLPGWSKHDENRLGYPPARDRAHTEAARGDSAARGVGMQRRHGRVRAGH